MIGFETIGNATLIAHDGDPLLATDPWITGYAYFGSWTFSHEIPKEQLDAIKKCRYVWVSHGHPDHLSSASIAVLRDKIMLLPDHVGGRILKSFKEQGFNVRVLKDRQWTSLSEHVKVLCISDYNQDGILLADINGRLVVDLNDANDRGWGPFVRRIISQYKQSFLLKLSGFGDADMINIHDEKGQLIPSWAAKKEPVGKQIAAALRHFGAKYFVPFSSMHRYQRQDSSWANQYTTALADHCVGFPSGEQKILPAFIRYDCAHDRLEEIKPQQNKNLTHDPKEFGDNWDDVLEPTDVAAIGKYFKAIEHLSVHFDFINMKVGGKDNVIELNKKRFNRGITFEAPRNSLMIAVQEEIFDDMLIGNFMKTTLHGKFSATGLYPDFTPYVAKYADNGLAKTKEELERYFMEYRRRAPFDFLRHRLERRSIETMRNFISMDSEFYRLIKGVYHRVKDR